LVCRWLLRRAWPQRKPTWIAKTEKWRGFSGKKVCLLAVAAVAEPKPWLAYRADQGHGFPARRHLDRPRAVCMIPAEGRGVCVKLNTGGFAWTLGLCGGRRSTVAGSSQLLSPPATSSPRTSRGAQPAGRVVSRRHPVPGYCRSPRSIRQSERYIHSTLER
jgi:hypothetical protein